MSITPDPATTKPQTFFAPIGDTAQAIETGTENEEDETDEEHCEGVDSIESLCMACGKNVRVPLASSSPSPLQDDSKTPTHTHTHSIYPLTDS